MKEVILKSLSFESLYKHLETFVFLEHKEIYQTIFEDLEVLADSNFMCYKANMEIINCRKEDEVNFRDISYFENTARTVGESRVNRKAKINQKINKMFPPPPPTEPEFWMSDDIVYSVGEMLDRISIEYIKQNHFVHTGNEFTNKMTSSVRWQYRVEKYLNLKLREIKTKQFYEVNDESRTYNV